METAIDYLFVSGCGDAEGKAQDLQTTYSCTSWCFIYTGILSFWRRMHREEDIYFYEWKCVLDILFMYCFLFWCTRS